MSTNTIQRIEDLQSHRSCKDVHGSLEDPPPAVLSKCALTTVQSRITVIGIRLGISSDVASSDSDVEDEALEDDEEDELELVLDGNKSRGGTSHTPNTTCA